MSSFVVNPKLAQTEVSSPVVSWADGIPFGNESWQGELTEDATVPQVELRRTLDNGASVVVRLNLGNLSTNSKGDEVAAGVVLTTNKAVVFSWREYFALCIAVNEGIDRLTALQEDTYAQLGAKWMGNPGDWSPESTVEGNKPA